MSRRVVVLGASGYLGRHVTQAARMHGHYVTAVSRHAAAMRDDTGVALCDASDRAALQRAAGGADCVINAIHGDPNTMVMVASNLRGLLHDDAVGRVLHVSSLAVYGQSSGVMHEGIAPVPVWGSRRAEGILQAELLMSPGERFGTRVAVIRPGYIYGPGAPVWVDGIARLLQARRLGWLGRRGQGACLLIHVQDLAEMITRAIVQSVSGVYNVTAPEEFCWNDYFFRMASLIGVLPLRRIGAAGLAAELWLGTARGLTGGDRPDAVTPTMAHAFRARARIVSIRAPLGEATSFRSLRDGSAEAAEAFLRQDWRLPTSRRSTVLRPSEATP